MKFRASFFFFTLHWNLSAPLKNILYFVNKMSSFIQKLIYSLQVYLCLYFSHRFVTPTHPRDALDGSLITYQSNIYFETTKFQQIDPKEEDLKGSGRQIGGAKVMEKSLFLARRSPTGFALFIVSIRLFLFATILIA